MFLIIICFALVLTIFCPGNIYPFFSPEIMIRERFRILSVLRTLACVGGAVYSSILNSGITRSIFKSLKSLWIELLNRLISFLVNI